MLPELEQANETVVEAYVIDVALRRGRHGRMAILRCLTRAQEIGDELPPTSAGTTTTRTWSSTRCNISARSAAAFSTT